MMMSSLSINSRSIPPKPLHRMVDMQPIARSSSNMSSMSVDAEPVSPMFRLGEMPISPYDDDLSSAQLSQDAIAGVPPRGRMHAAPAQPNVGHAAPLLPRSIQVQSQPERSQATNQPLKGSFSSTAQRDDISVRNTRHEQMSFEKDFKNDDDSYDSSYSSGSYSSSSYSSISSSSWEEELELYKDKMPTEVRVSYFDVMILYAEEDRELAEKFKDHLMTEIELPNNEKVSAVLYDSPELTGMSGSQIQHLDRSMERCTYVFVYLTKAFVKDKWCEFSSESCLMRAIYDEERRWCVVPVYTQRRSDCKFKIPMGLNSLKGINKYCNDEFYRRGVARLIADKVPHRKMQQAKHKRVQKTWLENFKREQIRVEEQKRRHAEQEEKQTRELRKKIGTLTDSDLFPNLKMHNCYSESNISRKGYPFSHSASMGSLKPVNQQNPAVAEILGGYKTNFRYATQRSYTPEQLELLSRLLEPDGNPPSPPDPIWNKFQGLNLRSQASSCSADMGVRSAASVCQGEVEMKLKSEDFEYLQTLSPTQQQEFLENLYQQDLQRQGNQSSYVDLPPHSHDSQLYSRDNISQNQTGLPQWDQLSVNSQHLSKPYSHSDDPSFSSNFSSSAGGDSSTALSETSHSYPGRSLAHSQGNVPTYLLDDSGSELCEDSGSLAESDDSDWTVVGHERVPRVTSNRGGKRNDGKKKNRQVEKKEKELDEKTNRNRQIVHQTIYHIYNPKAVQIGDENVVQDASGKPVDDNSDTEPEAETEAKAHGKTSVNDRRAKKEGKVKEVEFGKDESLDSHKPHREMSSEQLHGEMNDVQHNSGGMVAMDAALSSTGSCSPFINEGPTTGEGENKENLPEVNEDPESTVLFKNYNREKPVAVPKAVPSTEKITPEHPVVPPAKPVSEKHIDDTDHTTVKPKVVLPVRNSYDDCSDLSKNSPGVVQKMFERPMAKIGPCNFKNNQEKENTNPKSVIDPEETTLKCVAESNSTLEAVRTEAEHLLGGNAEETSVKTARDNSVQFSNQTSVGDSPKRSIMSYMPVHALERSGQSVKSSDTGSGQVPYNAQPFQGAPFSVSRHTDASSLFYNNRHKFDTVGPVEDIVDSIDEPELSNDPTEASPTNQLRLNRQEVPLGEDPLSCSQETFGFIPNEEDDGLEYDFVEDSQEDIISSTESQTSGQTSSSKLSRLLASIRGKRK